MGYLMAMTRDFEAAEEIFQNAAVVVMENAGQAEPIHDFRAWAKEVVRRQALHYFRETSRRRAFNTDPQVLEQITAVFLEDDTDDSHREREIKALRRCLGMLPATLRRMIGLRYESRSSFESIGVAVGSTVTAVQRAISRGRKSLLRCLQQATESSNERGELS